MELITTIYIILFSVMASTFGVIILAIAGKDIYLAFKRWFLKTGCDVYLANQTRIISHYYMKPKEGIFRIKKLPYVTNPEKTMNLTEVERGKVAEAILKRSERLKARIKEVQTKITELNGSLKISKDEKQIFFIKSQIEHYNSISKELSDKLRLKQENYFKDKRPAFFYIENDPIPKDFYEYYSALDAKMVDNLVSRSLSQPPSVETDKEMKNLKLIIMITGGAAVAAAYMAFTNQGMIRELCIKAGTACGLT